MVSNESGGEGGAASRVGKRLAREACMGFLLVKMYRQGKRCYKKVSNRDREVFIKK